MRLEEPLTHLINGEFVGLAAVIGSVLSVFSATLLVLLRLIVSKLRGSFNSLRAWEWGILSVGAAGALCICYGYFVEPNQFEVTHVQLQSNKLDGVTRPLRIVQISDTHCERNTSGG